MRAEGVGDAAIDTFAHYYQQLREGETGMIPEADDRAGRRTCPTLDDLPEADRARSLDTRRRDQAQRRPRHEHGHDRGQVAARGQGRADLPRHHRRARCSRLRERVRRRAAAGAHELLPHPRRHAGGAARATRTSTSDVPAGLPAEQGAQARAPTTCTPVELAATTPTLEWCPPGHGDLYTALRDLGLLDALLDARLPLRLRLQLRQPRRRARPAHPRAGSPRAERRSRSRPSERTEADRKGGHFARRTTDGRIVLRETAQTPEEDLEALQDLEPPPLRQHEQPLGRPATRCATTLDAPRRRPRPAADRQPQDGRPGATRPRPRSSRSRPRWARRSRCSRAPARCEVPRGASRRSRRPTTCSCCAPTPTSCIDDCRVELAPERDEPPFVDLDPDYYKLVGDFDQRFPAGPPSLRGVRAPDGRRRRDLRTRRRGPRSGDGRGAARIEDGPILTE